MGGFARRMSYWKAFQKKYPGTPLIRIDGGSLFAEGTAEAPVVNRWMVEGTFRSAMDAVNLTLNDLPVWQEMAALAAHDRMPEEFLRVPLVSANLVPKDPSFPRVMPYRIKEVQPASGAGKKTLRVGITGVLFDPEGRVAAAEFDLEEPRAALRRVIAELKERTDLRIVLTDMDLGKAISLAVGVPGIQILVVSHEYQAVSEPQAVGETMILMNVNEGRMLAEVRVPLGGEGRQPDVQARFVPLDKTVPDDEVLGPWAARALREIEALRAPAPPPRP